LGIIGVYLLAHSVSKALPSGSKSFGFHSLLALILVGLVVANATGWQAGQIFKDTQETGAYVLETYEIQPDENIRHYVASVPASITREEAKFLQENRLNVFSKATIRPSVLTPGNCSALAFLDYVDGKVVPQDGSPLVVDRHKQETVTIIGWAVDSIGADAASAVFVTIDGRIDIPTLYGLDRQDVAAAYGNPRYRFSGYMATFPSEILTVAEHTISIKIVSKDGLHYCTSGVLVRLIVT
jgi:hypothetical protein